ncbi:hypothetical protein CBW46_012545 [Paenibacillus xerothermodurans]|uniref:Uncharacterized protein n=2 Tax=Paenibacillus xerothermodurans TaxID=1977292 RepID=A0A2W1NC17_PAEXE|nr:hypothetical protein CBW46_012545 [Paenibacillus xerothermodurans]
MGHSHESPASMRLELVLTEIVILALKPVVPWYDSLPEQLDLLLFVVFLVYVLSRVRARLKRQLLDPLKFTSAYVVSAHSSP